MENSAVALIADHPHVRQTGRNLAAELALPFLENREQSIDNYEFLLTVQEAGLSLMDIREGLAPLSLNFLSGSLNYRRQMGGEILARVLGFKGSERGTIRVLDTTAGLGRDAFIIASLGYQVTMVEQSPAIFALVRDALERAVARVLAQEGGNAGDRGQAIKKATADREVLSRLSLYLGESSSLLAGEVELQSLLAFTPFVQRKVEEMDFDIIYLDPMFPERRKSAKVKKEMQYLQRLTNNLKIERMFELALNSRAKRVVVKRPSSAEPLLAQKPHHSSQSKSMRFDVYLTSGV